MPPLILFVVWNFITVTGRMPSVVKMELAMIMAKLIAAMTNVLRQVQSVAGQRIIVILVSNVVTLEIVVIKVSGAVAIVYGVHRSESRIEGGPVA